MEIFAEKCHATFWSGSEKMIGISNGKITRNEPVEIPTDARGKRREQIYLHYALQEGGKADLVSD